VYRRPHYRELRANIALNQTEFSNIKLRHEGCTHHGCKADHSHRRKCPVHLPNGVGTFGVPQRRNPISARQTHVRCISEGNRAPAIVHTIRLDGNQRFSCRMEAKACCRPRSQFPIASPSQVLNAPQCDLWAQPVSRMMWLEERTHAVKRNDR
jgi:hypothetical protein